MGDIDPYSQIQKLTPRGATIVDVIADTKRALDSSLRSNPLLNAHVDSGLMVWRGNYAGLGGINDSFLWIGEIVPGDPFKNSTQRAFLVTRDDPRHAPAFWMYDPAPGTTQSGSLRQLVRINDSDAAPIIDESKGGGVRFPYGQIVLYPQTEGTYTFITGGTTQETIPALNVPLIVPSATATTWWEGYGPMTGHKLKTWLTGWSPTATAGSWKCWLEIDWQDDTSGTYVSSAITVNANSFTSLFWDLDFAGQNKIGREVHVAVRVQTVTAGDNKWHRLYPRVCYSYGKGLYE